MNRVSKGISKRWWLIAITAAVPISVALIIVASLVFSPRYKFLSRGPLGDVSMLQPGSTSTFEGNRTNLTSSLRSFGQTVWITPSSQGLIVDQTALECHGGMAHVVWHIGNLEPIAVDTGIHLVARMDGRPVGALLRGTTVDTWGDDPAAIHAVVHCPSGLHEVDLEVRSIHGGWGFPYVVNAGEPAPADLTVNRGFIITEVWAADG
jgi:hypothetical protein